MATIADLAAQFNTTDEAVLYELTEIAEDWAGLVINETGHVDEAAVRVLARRFWPHTTPGGTPAPGRKQLTV